MSGKSSEDSSVQTASIVRRLGSDERKTILQILKQKVVVPPEHVAAMKSTLNLPWNQMREISRWLKTFDVKLSSEKLTRIQGKEWVGAGLIVEYAPLSIRKKTGRTEIVETPWAYIYNIVGHVLKRLKCLADNKQLIQQKQNIHIKIGGDHGGNSFKMGYQVGNVMHPNRKENTVIFCLFEGKDTRSNLRTCLARYRTQIEMLGKVKYDQQNILVFLYGDYEFLCIMYGLSGANGIQYFHITSLKFSD